MGRFVALLRGVNVGGAKRVPMAALRDILADIGYAEVQTLLNSGNAVFSSSGRSAGKHAAAIKTAIGKALAIDVPVVVKSAHDIAAIHGENALAHAVSDYSRLLAVFAADQEALLALTALTPLVRPPERMQIGAKAAYLWCPDGILKSKVANALLGKGGPSVTSRNWATVLKIAALLRRFPEAAS